MAATYTIKNAGSIDKAFKVRGGHEIVPAGKEREVTVSRALTEDQIDAFGREGVKITKKDKTDKKVVTDKEIIDGLSADDKAAFDKLDDAAKAAFLADKKAA